MKTITVSASRTYPIRIGSGLLSSVGETLRDIKPCYKVLIVSDSNVWPLYGSVLSASLQRAGFCVEHFVFPAGEASKNSETYLQLLNFLAEKHITRSDLMIALGGGVVGDLTGFAAATYLRGIDFVQIPTTLLAAVDSSVGGKTAIDLPAGKNLVGAFHQPIFVLCDTDTLQTLPEDVFLDGCGEVVKYAILYDADLFTHLESLGSGFDLENVIARCVELKRDVVAQDEFDCGVRQKLNLGHTFGHAIEQSSNFTIPHGKAVAIGIAMITRAAATSGLCSQEDADRILAGLDRLNLPCRTDLSADKLLSTALSDKKRSGETINLIVPRTIGYCDILTIPVNQLESFIKEGL